MPGPWYGSAQDPEYFPNVLTQKGDVLEVGAYDDEGYPQGTLLLRIEHPGSTSSKGRWFMASTIAASDPYFQWWLDNGGGPKVISRYHFCAKGYEARGVADGKGRDVTRVGRMGPIP